jgi:hypothetical protein
MLVSEDPGVTVKCRTAAIKALFLYLNVCLIVKFDSLPWTYPLLSRWFIREEQTSRSMCIRVVLIKEKTFLSGTIITGNDVIEFENEVQCTFCCSSLQWSYYALSYIILLYICIMYCHTLVYMTYDKYVLISSFKYSYHFIH